MVKTQTPSDTVGPIWNFTLIFRPQIWTSCGIFVLEESMKSTLKSWAEE